MLNEEELDKELLWNLQLLSEVKAFTNTNELLGMNLVVLTFGSSDLMSLR